jgi:hypothetical protein
LIVKCTSYRPVEAAGALLLPVLRYQALLSKSIRALPEVGHFLPLIYNTKVGTVGRGEYKKEEEM